MNRKGIGFSLLVSIIMAAFLAAGNAIAKDPDPSRLLISRNAEFNKEILRVSDNVYTAVGYAVSPVSMIVGPQGIVIVDAGLDVASSREIRAGLSAHCR